MVVVEAGVVVPESAEEATVDVVAAEVVVPVNALREGAPADGGAVGASFVARGFVGAGGFAFARLAEVIVRRPVVAASL
jgi:hypothetical protein